MTLEDVASEVKEHLERLIRLWESNYDIREKPQLEYLKTAILYLEKVIGGENNEK